MSRSGAGQLRADPRPGAPGPLDRVGEAGEDLVHRAGPVLEQLHGPCPLGVPCHGAQLEPRDLRLDHQDDLAPDGNHGLFLHMLSTVSANRRYRARAGNTRASGNMQAGTSCPTGRLGITAARVAATPAGELPAWSLL